MTLSGREVV